MNNRILIIGNGINRSFDNGSWGDIVDQMSCGRLSDSEEKALCNMPLPLQAVVSTDNNVDEGVKLIAEHLLNTDVKDEQKEIINGIVSCGFDAVLTTNYSYEIEKSIDDRFVCKLSSRSKYRRTSKAGNASDEQFGLYKYLQVGDNKVWHIHGEAARPRSVVLGHYYYGKIISRIQKQLGEVVKSFNICKAYDKDFIPGSWIDYFMTSDIYIVGLGLDFSEMDLWWLLDAKFLHRKDFGHHKVVWFEPNMDKPSNSAKRILAKTYGIDIVTENVESKEYLKYYKKLPEKITEEINNGSF